MSLAFSLKSISKTYGDDTLFHNLSIDFKFNEQLGIIGNNGSGKSTLLKIMAGDTLPDDGERVIKKGLRVTYLPQEDDLDPDVTVEQLLYNSLRDLPIDEPECHKIVKSSIGRGGFNEPDTLCGELSGGWKKRLSIIRAFCLQPDILLMDEPTNHLDLDGILWLETILKSAQFSFILVSHDRSFLDSVCLNIMEIGPYFPEGYFKISGNYSHFTKIRDQFLLAQEKKQQSLASKMRREEEWLRQGPKARTSKAKFRIDQAHLLRSEIEQLKQRNQRTAKVAIDFHGTGRKTKKLIRAFEIQKQVSEVLLFSQITFEIGPGFCLGVVGDNGSGKSTFLSVIEKTILPDSGKVEWAQDLKIAVFDQHRLKLNPDDTLRDALNPPGGDSVNYKGRPVHIVTWAKRFLFLPDQLDMPVRRLSGGEKARIMLANLMLHPCDVLLLDEPTNDLDILSLQVLEQSILQFPGSVIIVSHDRYLMDTVCHRMLYLEPGNPSLFFKDFTQILSHRNNKPNGRIKKKESTSKKPNSRNSKSVLFSYKDKYELEHIEENILNAEERVSYLENKIQDPSVISDNVQMDKFCLKLKEAQEKVQALYDRWEVLEQKKAEAD